MATVTETESQTKRKASTAGLSGAPRPVKRRASKACCCCRARKVRCDVVENGSPCTNCRLDQVECVVTESKRRKLVFTARKKKKYRKETWIRATPRGSTKLTVGLFAIVSGSRVVTRKQTSTAIKLQIHPRIRRKITVYSARECLAMTRCRRFLQCLPRRRRSTWSKDSSICRTFSVRIHCLSLAGHLIC